MSEEHMNQMPPPPPDLTGLEDAEANARAIRWLMGICHMYGLPMETLLARRPVPR